MATVKSFKGDVSSVSPSSVALSAGIFAVSLSSDDDSQLFFTTFNFADGGSMHSVLLPHQT